MLRTLYTLSTQRRSWLLLAALALALDGIALFLQHVLQVEPCNECIYIRVGVLGIALAGLMGALAPSYWPMRLLALVVWVGALDAWSTEGRGDGAGSMGSTVSSGAVRILRRLRRWLRSGVSLVMAGSG